MRVPKAVNAAEYAQSYNEANINDVLNPFYTETEINKFANHSDPERYPDAVSYTHLKLMTGCADFLFKIFPHAIPVREAQAPCAMEVP